MMRDVPFNALFFGFYETICSAMMRFQSLESKADLGTPSVFFAGGLASLMWSSQSMSRRRDCKQGRTVLSC